MKTKSWLAILSILVFVTSLSFSQQKSGNIIQPDVESPSSTPISEGELVTNALKATSFFDGYNTFVNSKVKFELYSKDNIAIDKIIYRINNKNEVEYTSPFSIFEEGKHTITYYAIDKVGNKEEPKTFKVIVDNTPPVVTVTVTTPLIKSGDKLYTSKNVTFAIDAKDALSGVKSVEYSLDKTNYLQYFTPFNITSDGNITLSIKAMDNVTNVTEKYSIVAKDDAGNTINLTSSNIEMFVDNKPPMIEIRSDKEFVIRNGKKIATPDYLYTVLASDEGSGIASILVRIDGKGEFKTYTGAIKFDTNGDHFIEAKAIDKVGNCSSTAILSVFVDTIAPETTIKTSE